MDKEEVRQLFSSIEDFLRPFYEGEKRASPCKAVHRLRGTGCRYPMEDVNGDAKTFGGTYGRT